MKWCSFLLRSFVTLFTLHTDYFKLPDYQQPRPWTQYEHQSSDIFTRSWLERSSSSALWIAEAVKGQSAAEKKGWKRVTVTYYTERPNPHSPHKNPCMTNKRIFLSNYRRKTNKHTSDIPSLCHTRFCTLLSTALKCIINALWPCYKIFKVNSTRAPGLLWWPPSYFLLRSGNGFQAATTTAVIFTTC